MDSVIVGSGLFLNLGGMAIGYFGDSSSERFSMSFRSSRCCQALSDILSIEFLEGLASGDSRQRAT
jgi:hypothetical protein